jgi:hypothetical protein
VWKDDGKTAIIPVEFKGPLQLVPFNAYRSEERFVKCCGM